MSTTLPEYKGEIIQVYPLKLDVSKIYEATFPDINDTKLITVNKVDDKIIVDESFFTLLSIIKPFDSTGGISNDPLEVIGVAKTVVYCDFDKNVGFFIWKSTIKEEIENAAEEQEQNQEQTKTSINNILLGSIGAAAVATGAVVGTLFGVGILGGKSKKNKKNKKRRKGQKTRRKTKKRTKRRTNKKVI